MSGPDSGFAWCVAFAACIINFIMAGLGRMSGILYVAFIDMYDVDRRGASIPFSIRSSARNLLGPVVGILGQKYSVRTVAMTGGIIGTVSAASCIFANDILWISILWGAFNGVGAAMTTTLNQVVIGQYFKKYRTTAAGMGISGGCVGSFIFPVLLELMLQTYGLQGTFLIMAGIIMHTVPAAMILRKPWWVKKRNKELKNAPRTSQKIEKVSVATTMTDEARRLHQESFANQNAKDAEIENGNFSGVRDSKEGHGIQKSPDSQDKVNNLRNLVDFEFLRQNLEVVNELLNIRAKDENCVGSASHTKGLENKSFEFDETDRQGTEDILHFFQTFDIPANFSARICSAVENQTKNNQIVYFERDKCESDGVRIQSFPNIVSNLSQFENWRYIQRRTLLVQKLKHVAQLRKSDVGSSFPEQNESRVLEVLSEMRNLNNAVQQCETDCARSIHGEPKTPDTTKLGQPKRTGESSPSTSFKNLFVVALKLHTKPIFLLICFCRCVHFITFIPVVAFVVDYSMDKGLQEEDGKYVIAALSLGDLIGRMCLGWVTDRGYLSPARYMMIVMVLQAASTGVIPLSDRKIVLLPMLALFGLLQGSLFVRHPVLVNKYMASQEQSVAMGCVNFFAGCLGFALPSYIGYFRDIAGSYDGMFYINGVIGTTVGLLWSLEPLLVRWSNRNPDEGVEQNM